MRVILIYSICKTITLYKTIKIKLEDYKDFGTINYKIMQTGTIFYLQPPTTSWKIKIFLKVDIEFGSLSTLQKPFYLASNDALLNCFSLREATLS